MPASLYRTLVSAGMSPYKRRAGSPRRSEIRSVYLSQNVQRLLVDTSDIVGSKQKAGIYARLNRFIEGARLTVSTAELGNGQGDIKCLRGYDEKLFQMRFYDVAPQYRMLGVFPQQDVFLACKLALRNDLEHAWASHCQRVLGQLKAMGTYSPECLDASDMNKVLTNWAISK